MNLSRLIGHLLCVLVQLRDALPQLQALPALHTELDAKHLAL